MPFYICIQRVPGPNCREDFTYTVDFGDFPQFLLANSDIASIRPQALLPHPSLSYCSTLHFLQFSHQHTLCISLPVQSATDLAHIILFDLIVLNVRWGEQIMTFTIMQFPRLHLCLLPIQWCNDTYLSSQMTAFRSRWFVGSSNNRRVGSRNKALARDTLIRQPPEKFLVARFCISLENPKPAKIRRARGSAESALIAFSSS